MASNAFVELVSETRPLIINYADLYLDDNEKIIIYKLSQNGPAKTENELAKRTKWVPDKHKQQLKPSSQHYSLVRAAIKKLEQKGFVKTKNNISKFGESIEVELTLPGLFLYLYHKFDMKAYYSDAFNKNRSLFPFDNLWDEMTRRFKKDVRMGFAKTLKNCRQLKREKFSIDILDAKFKSFTKWRPKLSTEEEDKPIEKERNIGFLDFLKEPNSEVLRGSYIAYLIIQDMPKIEGRTKAQIETLVHELKSEQESALLEGRDVKSHSLLIANRIGEFFPKYGNVEFFFTDMFVNNLLWK